MHRPKLLLTLLLLLAGSVDAATAGSRPRLAFSESRDLTGWQGGLREELKRILALPTGKRTALMPKLSPPVTTTNDIRRRIEFTSEPGARVPGHLLLPKRGTKPFPVMICLQGHSPGMHISIGEARNAKERNLIRGGRDLARQAVAHGWAAVVIEQRAFGERATQGVSCQNQALQDLLKGRPLTGQRVFDVTRAIDFIETRPELDASRIGCIGNSTGGTVSFYTACVEPRIRLAVVSCSFGTFESTWLYKQHCACGYLPGLLKFADMPDLAGLVTPRQLMIVAGKEDYLARFDGVRQGFETARKIYVKSGHPGRISFIVGAGGHQFYPDQTWPLIQQTLKAWDGTAVSE